MDLQKVLYADSSFEDLRDFENALAAVGATVVHDGCKTPEEVIASGSDAVCIVTEQTHHVLNPEVLEQPSKD